MTTFSSQPHEIKTDFVTICFRNEIEIDLMKLQAISFCFVPPSMVNQIFLFWNDDGEFPSDVPFMNYYPYELRPKVKCVTRDTLFYSGQKTNWINQQIYKLLLAKYVQSSHYIVLDAKNHFMKPVTRQIFFTDDGKPKLFMGTPGKMIRYFDYCLKYFDMEKGDLTKKTFFSMDDPDFQFCTTTPFVFKTQVVREMVAFMESKENMEFDELFRYHEKGTEFYFYISYLFWKNYIMDCHIQKKIHITMWSDFDKEWNHIDYISKRFIEDESKMLGIHRKALVDMDEKTLRKLLKMYEKYYPKHLMKKVKQLRFFEKKKMMN